MLKDFFNKTKNGEKNDFLSLSEAIIRSSKI